MGFNLGWSRFNTLYQRDEIIMGKHFILGKTKCPKCDYNNYYSEVVVHYEKKHIPKDDVIG